MLYETAVSSVRWVQTVYAGLKRAFSPPRYHSRLLVLGFTGWNSADSLPASSHGPPNEPSGPGNLPALMLNRLLVKHCSVIGIYLFAFVDAEPELAKQMWREINAALEAGDYRPAVFHKLTGGLRDLPEALRLTLSRKAYGKVVVTFDDDDGGTKDAARVLAARL
jgi:hypothetical protein